jgi:hypothetical protein
MDSATNPSDTNELRQIADTIERNGGWHIAAVKVRAAADRLDALELKPKPDATGEAK